MAGGTKNEETKVRGSDNSKTSIAIIDEKTIRNKIYEVRGAKVMLDFELAAIYGYNTTAFNQQVKNNIEKFEGDDFCFYLTQEEFRNLMSKNLISSWGGRRKPPRAFTESGIYMLMTVLKGKLAVKQSRALIKAFRSMKDYIIENQNMIGQREYLQLSLQVSDNLHETAKMRGELNELGDQMNEVMDKLSNVVERSEIAPFMLDFGKPADKREYLILNGQPLKADEAYVEIYSFAKNNIFIIDDYISIKTLHHLQGIDPKVKVTILSDNVRNQLHAEDYADFQTESPGINITFIKTLKKIHDRYVILDYKTKDEQVFQCGSSSKDAGRQMTTIVELNDEIVKASLNEVIKELLNNPELELK